MTIVAMRYTRKQTMHITNGGCSCNNIQMTCTTTNPTQSISPRACDCQFCLAHQASYFSDNAGVLEIDISDNAQVSIERQGADLAEFYCCKRCGELAFVCYRAGKDTYAAANSGCFKAAPFDQLTVVQPRLLSGEQKTERWQAVWFSTVVFNKSL